MKIKDPEEVRDTVLHVLETMLARKVITRGEARTTIFGMAEDLRRENMGTLSEEAAIDVAHCLEKAAEERWPRK